MSRTKLVVIAACGLVGLGVIALYRALADDASEPPPPAAAQAEPERTPQPAPLVPTPAPPLAAEPVPAVPAPVAARKEAAEDAPYPKDLRQLVKALQPLQAEVVAGLVALDESSRCRFDKVIVLLTLETRRGEVLIHEVVIKPRPVDRDPAVEALGPDAGVTEEVVDEADARCVREALEGKALRTPSARSGRSWQQWYWPSPRPR